MLSRTHSRSFYTPVSLLLGMLLEPTSIFFHRILGMENCLILFTCPLNRAPFSWGPQINIVQPYLSYIRVCVLNHSVTSNSLWPRGLQPARLLCPWVFPREEYCSALPGPPTGDLPDPGIKPRSHALQTDSLPESLPRIPMDRGAWQAAVHGVIKDSNATNWLTLTNTNTQTHTYTIHIYV